MRPPRRRGWAFSPLGFVRRVFVGAYEDNIFFLASALTFDALLAALPFALLLLATFGYFLHDGVETVADLVRFMDAMLPSGGTVESIRRLEALVESVIESRGQFSIWGVPLFLWFATRLFSGARTALNEVFDTPENRGFFMGKLVDLLMVLVSLVLVVGNAALTILLARSRPGRRRGDAAARRPERHGERGRGRWVLRARVPRLA